MNLFTKNIVLMFAGIRIYLVNYFYESNKNKKAILTGKLLRYYAEFLGPTFTKCCQSLVYRDDLLPELALNELKPLLNHCTPEKNLETKVTENFPTVENLTLVGSGTIAHVYSGYIGNKKYAFKVKRTNIEEIMETDILLLESWLKYLNTYLPQYKLYKRFQHFKKAVSIQTNFRQEIENISLFQKAAKKLQFLTVVNVHQDLSTNDIIVMDFVEGETLNETTRVTEKHLYIEIFKLWINSLCDYNIVHGDLHFGNIIKTHDDKIVILDFGLVFNIETEFQCKIIEYFGLLLKRDYNKTTEWLLTNYIEGDITDEFQKELKQVVEDCMKQDDSEVNSWDCWKRINALLLKYNLSIAENYVELEISYNNCFNVLTSLNNDCTLIKVALDEVLS